MGHFFQNGNAGRSISKQLLVLLILTGSAFLSFETSAQVTGDYRTRIAAVTWTTDGDWERFDGVSWVTVTSEGYPGEFATVGTVTIQNGHNATIGAVIPNSIGNLSLQGSGILTYSAGFTFAITGNLTMDGTSQITAVSPNANRRLDVAGTFSVPGTSTNAIINIGQINVTGATSVTGTLTLSNGTVGVKTFIGAVSNSGTWTSTAITTTDKLVFRNGVSSTGTFLAGSATFNTNDQSIGGNAAMSFASVVNISGATVDVTNSNTNTIAITGTAAAQLTGTAGASWIQGTNSTLSYAGSTITNITLTAATNKPNTVNYTGATATIFPANYHNLTYSGTTTATVATGTSVTISGDLTVNSGTFTAAGTGTVVFNSTTAAQTISGVGAFTFVNITLSAGSAFPVNVDKSISIDGTLNFTAANSRLLVLNSSSDITLGTTASITNYDADSYIESDGTSATNGNLIKINSNSTADWVMTFPIGTSTGGYTPVIIPTVVTAPAINSTLSVKAITTGDRTGQLKRTFRMEVSGNGNATTFSGATFNYNNTTDISSGDTESVYTTEWLYTSGGSWSNIATIGSPTNQFTVAASEPLSTGSYYYTIGTAAGYSGTNTWYSYQTGNYSDPEVWTLDPSGTTLDNPISVYPSSGDAINILNGITVTFDLSNQTLSSTSIDAGATLDMFTTTGHNLGPVTGTGLLKVKGIALPSGTYTDFVSAIGGTIEYYDIGGNLPVTQTTYNKLKLTNGTGLNINYVLVSDMTVNGTFDITSTGAGTAGWQINDATATSRTIGITGDVTVSANGQIRAGTGNSGTQHSVTLYGNLTNNGSIKFFDASDASFSDASYTSGAVYTTALKGNAVNVTFANVTTDQTLTCNNTTDFYRLIVNKGTGQQSMLTVNSSATSNFRLFGPTNIGSANGAVPNEVSNNALSIYNGTIQLTGNIDIPNLAKNGTSGSDYFSIPQNGALWINGAGVTVTVADNLTSNDDQRLIANGMFRITAGTLNAGDSKGIGSFDGGSFILEGGTVNCWMFRPKGNGTGIFSFKQSGGTFNVGYGYALDGGVDATGFYRFDLNSTNSTFEMTGGILNIAKPSGGAGAGAFQVLSSSANYSVTGGTVNIYTGFVTAGTENEGYINSTAPLFDVNIYRESGTTTSAQLAHGIVVLNDITLHAANSPSFLCNNLGLTIGRNFDIQIGTTFTPANSNILFNGTGAQTWTHNGTITSLANVAMNKASGTLTLAGSQTFPDIGTNLTLTAGTLADGGKTITVTGSIVSNSATHTGAGVIVLNGAVLIGGSNGTFGNLTIQTNSTVATSGAQTVTGTLRLEGASTTLNIVSNAFTALGNIYSDASPGTAEIFSSTKMIRTSGLHNAGGLTRQGVAGDLLFPVGTTTVYTPNIINVAATTYGTITVRPVSSEHPNVTTTGQSLQYYWRVTNSGYAGITAVTHKTYTFSTATKSGVLTSYRSGRYDASNNSWGTNNTTYDATGTTVIPDFSTGTSWAGVTGDQLDGEYTCGDVSAFGGVQNYYSIATGNWNTPATWSTVSHIGAAAGAIPCATCPIEIGDGGSNNHTVTITTNSTTGGSLVISTGSTLDCSTFTALDFGNNTCATNTQRGTLRIASSTWPTGDFTNFVGSSGGTVEWYGATKTIPTTIGTYYNLVINPNTGQTITMPARSLTIYNDFTQGSPTTFTGTIITNGSRTLTITGNFSIAAGTFNFSNATSVTTLSVGGNVSVANGAALAVVAGGTANINTLSTPGGITNDGTIGFNNTSVVNITFTGTSDVNFDGTGSGGTTLNLVTVNKGTSQTPTVNFSVGGTVTAATSGWLSLTNGTFNFNNSGAYSISTASASYTIPTTARLKGSAGTVNVLTANNTAADLLLNGALEVTGGTINIGNAANTIDNDIEYASTGTPNITVSSGTLNVNGSIRRSTSTISGALVYNQTGGTVTVGGKASNNTRGVFEIDANTGSSFTLTGLSTLNIERQTNGTGYADVFIHPVTSSISSTSTIAVGLASATTQNNLRVNIVPSIGNFSVLNGAGTNAQTVKLFSNPMIVGGTLTIPTPSVLVTNSLDVTISGDLSCSGTYTGGTNTTTFNGTGAQAATLSATSTFNNLTVSKTAGTTLTLSGTSPTLTNLNILTGILDVGSLDLTVGKDITNNSSQVGAGSVVMTFTTSGTRNIFSSGGSFTNLTLGGASVASKTASVTGGLTINGTLNFSIANRYLMMNANELIFGSSSPAITGAGSTAFIKTNGVSSDLGVTKNWGTGTSSFVYEIGTLTNYTPVSYSLNVVATGTLNVIPVNSKHPTANSASAEQILSYYWIVNRGSSLDATATADHTYSYPSSLIGGTGGTLVAGYLDVSNPFGWITSGHGGTATTTQMTFISTPTSNFPVAGGTYDYSVGTVNTLPNPIVAVYSRLANANVSNPGVGGNWNNVNSWTTQSDGLGPAVAVAPTGVPVVILSGARINANTAGRKAFQSTIDGLLVVTTSGHNFGIIGGTGTMRINSGTFPAGDYTSFVSSSGGTIEYVVSSTLTMNSRSTYNNLSVESGSAGTLTMTATDLVVNGSLTIPSAVTMDNASNKDITIAKDWSNSGTFSPGTGTVNFNGTAAQALSGSTTFNNLAINNSGNVTLGGTTSVAGVLTLAAGNIISNPYPATPFLTLGSASTISGGSASSFVSGQIQKTINSGITFSFPVGSNSAARYRPVVVTSPSATDTWDVSYISGDPTDDGYSIYLFNGAKIGEVSSHEYWQVANGSGTTSAGLTLSYDVGSYGAGGIGILDSLKTARWNGTMWDLPPGGGSFSYTGNSTAGTVSVSFQNSFSPQTIVTGDVAAALPIELIYFKGEVVKNEVQLTWETGSEINNDFFTIERSASGEAFSSIGSVKGSGTTNHGRTYNWMDSSPLYGVSYYRLKQTDIDGAFTHSKVIAVQYEGPQFPVINVFPNPSSGNQVTIEIEGLKNVRTIPITIYDQMGREQISLMLEVDENSGSASKLLTFKDQLSSGMYIIMAGPSRLLVKRFVVSEK